MLFIQTLEYDEGASVLYVQAKGVYTMYENQNGRPGDVLVESVRSENIETDDFDQETPPLPADTVTGAVNEDLPDDGVSWPILAAIPNGSIRSLPGTDTHPVSLNQGTTQPEHLNLNSDDLICPINPEEIARRWLNNYIPLDDQVPKRYHPTISSLIERILKSYASAAVRGSRYPPFIHHSQTRSGNLSSPLASCFSVIRMCQTRPEGADTAVTQVLHREMSVIYEEASLAVGSPTGEAETRDGVFILACFQAYLLYTLVLFFRPMAPDISLLRPVMPNLQHLASMASREGLVTRSDTPSWESWIVAEAKRRTLYTTYLFDNVLSRQENLPTFLGTELTGLPTPSGKSLWEATERGAWAKEWERGVRERDGEAMLAIEELWGVPLALEHEAAMTRRARVDRWLEDIDEFGLLVYTVTGCTHGT